jgi:hypothetical protein
LICFSDSGVSQTRPSDSTIRPSTPARRPSSARPFPPPEHHTAALLSPAGKIATQKLRDEFKVQEFDPATKEEYAGLGKLLRDT